MERLVPSCSELNSPGAHTQSLERPQSWRGFPKNVNPRYLETYFLLGLEGIVPGRQTAFQEAPRFLCPGHLESGWGHDLSGGARGRAAGTWGLPCAFGGAEWGVFCFCFDF